MKKVAFILVSFFMCVVFTGCLDSGNKSADADPLSQVLYEAEAADGAVLSENYSIHESMAGLFDNIPYENVLEDNKTDDNEDKNETDYDNLDESIEAFAYADTDTVWISASGTKYHSKSSCSGMKNPSAVSKEQAQSEGYAACKRCF